MTFEGCGMCSCSFDNPDGEPYCPECLDTYIGTTTKLQAVQESTAAAPLDEPAFQVTLEQRLAISTSINLWFADIQSAGTEQWKNGSSGHVGTFTLRAEVNDAGVSFFVQRAIEEQI